MYRQRIQELENEIVDSKAMIANWNDEGDRFYAIGYEATAQAKWEYAASQRWYMNACKHELASLRRLQAAHVLDWLIFMESEH